MVCTANHKQLLLLASIVDSDDKAFAILLGAAPSAFIHVYDSYFCIHFVLSVVNVRVHFGVWMAVNTRRVIRFV